MIVIFVVFRLICFLSTVFCYFLVCLRAEVLTDFFAKDVAGSPVFEAGYDLLCRADFRNFSEVVEFLNLKIRNRDLIKKRIIRFYF